MFEHLVSELGHAIQSAAHAADETKTAIHEVEDVHHAMQAAWEYVRKKRVVLALILAYFVISMVFVPIILVSESLEGVLQPALMTVAVLISMALGLVL